MPNSRKRRRQSLLRVVDLHQVPLQQSVCQQDVHQVGLLQEPVQQKNPLVHELRLKMKNKLMPLWNKMMLCKHFTSLNASTNCSRIRLTLSFHVIAPSPNFLMNLCTAQATCCFFENKPKTLPIHFEKSRQLELL